MRSRWNVPHEAGKKDYAFFKANPSSQMSDEDYKRTKQFVAFGQSSNQKKKKKKEAFDSWMKKYHPETKEQK